MPPKLIDKSMLTPEMVLRNDILSASGAVLVPRGIVLTEELIKGIKRFPHVHTLEIDDKRESEQEKFLRKSFEVKEESVRHLILSISDGNPVDQQIVEDTVNGIRKDFAMTSDVLACMRRVNDVDNYTYRHSLNVSMLAMLMGRWLKMTEAQSKDLATAGLLHDIGKSKISKDILLKEGALTPEEYEEVKKHSTYSYRLLQEDKLSKEILMGILMHHEREDGSGYPLGAKGDQIPLYGKILAVCDIYSAMVSMRPYKGRQNPFIVIKEMLANYKGKLDYGLMHTLFYNVAMSHVHEYVLLNTGEIGQIAFINPREVLRPIVRIDTVLVDLQQEHSLEIEDIL